MKSNMNSQIRYEINQLLLHLIILELQVVSVTSNGNVEIKIRPIVEKSFSTKDDREILKLNLTCVS